jgi:hypothetical protein
VQGAVQGAVAQPIAAPKRRGRPPGSKTKPKAALAEEAQVEQTVTAKKPTANKTVPVMASSTATSVATQQDGGDDSQQLVTKKRQATCLAGPPPPVKVTKSGRTVRVTAKAAELAAQKAAE